jgi:hypothetical protein
MRRRIGIAGWNSHPRETLLPLHIVSEPGDQSVDDVYATLSSDQRVPKYRMPDHTSSAPAIYNLVHDELLLDGNSRQNLATFCTTWAEPEAHQLMNESLDKNMIDKDEYPQTAEIEKRCVHMIAVSGTRRGHGKPSAAPPPVPARRACWEAWR